MLSFSLSEEQTMMKETISKLVLNNIKDNAHDMDESGNIPVEFIRKFNELGTIPSVIPEEYGGYGMENSPIMNSIILEELAYGDMGFAIAATLPSLFLTPVLDMGTDDQKKKYLSMYVEQGAEAPCTMAMNEMHFKFDTAALQTKAEKKNKAYILNGKKCFVPLAETAKHIMVSAALDGKNNLFVVEKDNPGLSVGEREKNIGLDTLATYPVSLENCEVPADDRLGGENGIDFNRILQKSRTAISAIASGIVRASYDYSREYAKERVQFGDPIGTRQSVAFMIAEMAYEADSIRLMTWKAASALESGRDAQREAFLAWIYAGDLSMKMSDYGVQVLGGHGYIRDHPVERYYRNSRMIATLEGIATV